MRNLAMEAKLQSGEALDVNLIGQLVMIDGERTFKLNRFQEDIDYCNAKAESWIWSIGLKDGEYFAAETAFFYGNPNYECVWLR